MRGGDESVARVARTLKLARRRPDEKWQPKERAVSRSALASGNDNKMMANDGADADSDKKYQDLIVVMVEVA